MKFVGNPYIIGAAAPYTTKSMDFDGVNDYLNIATMATAHTAGIISFWLYRDIETVNQRLVMARETSWSADNQFVIQVQNNGGGQANDILVRHRVSATDNYLWYFNTNITASAWFHIAVWHNGTNLKCYVDGTEITSITKTTTNDETKWLDDLNTNSITRWLFGILDNGATSLPLDGQMDEITIWNSTSAVAIADLANSSTDIGSLTNYGTNCVHHWRGGEGSDDATNVFDVAGSSDLTWTNADADPYSTNTPP